MSEPSGTGSAGPETKKRPWIKWVALGCSGLIVVVAALVFFTTMAVKRATAGPEKVVHEFLAAAGQGDYAAAHDYFSAPLKQVQPLDEFAAAAKANAMFFQIKDTTFSNRSIDMKGAKFSGTVTLVTGTEVPASFALVRENSKWKLLSYHIGS